MKPHVDVLIATPGHSLHGAYVKSLLETIQVLGSRGITSAWLNHYASHVADARDATLANTMNNLVNDSRPLHGAATYNKIVWIDSDISWEPSAFLALYDSPLDIVSGAYLLSTGEVTAYPKLLGPGYQATDIIAMTNPVKVEAVGFGFVAVRSGIFEQLSRPWFQSVNVSIRDESGGDFIFPLMGEDMSWCKRVRELGYDVWLDPNIRVTHHKTMALSWDWSK